MTSKHANVAHRCEGLRVLFRVNIVDGRMGLFRAPATDGWEWDTLVTGIHYCPGCGLSTAAITALEEAP